MGRVLKELSNADADFIAKQRVFFVATAPLSADHHVSVSPKAPGNACIVLDPHTVAYADLTGSGSETAAHVMQNGRMTIIFVNIETGPPKIMRLHGTAELILAENVPTDLLQRFPSKITSSPGFRAVFRLNVHRISTSCGYSMPVMHFEKYRTILDEYTEKLGKEGMVDFLTCKNSFSIDGLPSIALMRSNAPKNVVPVPENGYIFGKVVVQQENGGGATTTPQQDRKKLHYRRAAASSSSSRCSIRLSPLELGIASAVVFAVGVACGQLLSKRR